MTIDDDHQASSKWAEPSGTEKYRRLDLNSRTVLGERRDKAIRPTRRTGRVALQDKTGTSLAHDERQSVDERFNLITLQRTVDAAVHAL